MNKVVNQDGGEKKKVRKPLLKPHEIEEEELKNFEKILKTAYDMDDEDKL